MLFLAVVMHEYNSIPLKGSHSAEYLVILKEFYFFGTGASVISNIRSVNVLITVVAGFHGTSLSFHDTHALLAICQMCWVGMDADFAVAYLAGLQVFRPSKDPSSEASSPDLANVLPGCSPTSRYGRPLLHILIAPHAPLVGGVVLESTASTPHQFHFLGAAGRFGGLC